MTSRVRNTIFILDHNSIHASDVLHAINFLSVHDDVKDTFESLDLLAMYIAASIHDFKHPGLNNNFLITTSDNLAILYNDKSVLENYHLSQSFQLLLKKEMNFVGHLSNSEWVLFREKIVEMVLATDLSQHYSILSLFKSRVKNLYLKLDAKPI
jgi:hypothetical protein